MKKSINNGILNYQEESRCNSLKKIDEALHYMFNNGIKISLSSIARYADVSNALMYKPHVKDYLASHPIYSSLDKNLIYAQKEKMEELSSKNEKLKKQLDRTTKKVQKLEYENIKLKEQIKNLNEEKMRILGRAKFNISLTDMEK